MIDLLHNHSAILVDPSSSEHNPTNTQTSSPKLHFIFLFLFLFKSLPPHRFFTQTHNPLLQISLHLVFSLRRLIHFTAQRSQLRENLHHSLLLLSAKLRISLQREHRALHELLIVGIHRNRGNRQRLRHLRVLQDLLSITPLFRRYFVQKQIVLFVLVHFAGVSSEQIEFERRKDLVAAVRIQISLWKLLRRHEVEPGVAFAFDLLWL